MIQALNVPYSSKTEEIMSRYRPIAPKPDVPPNNTDGPAASVPEKFRQSPYLRNMWSHLQARPTRTRKRARTTGISPPAGMLRKQQGGPTFIGLPRNLPLQAFGIFSDHHVNNDNNNYNDVVELPLLKCPMLGLGSSKAIDLNTVAETLEERDLLLQLELQVPNNHNKTSSSVISPRPVRPVGSSISIVGPIIEDPEAPVVVSKTPDEVEAAAEEEALPAVISDRGNKVRMANSAYKELIGQPECSWLDAMSPGRRISGEVMLRLSESGLPVSGNGFSCWVRIEWENDGKKSSANAFSDVVRLACESKDYLFCWRFHTRELSPSGSKV